MKSCWDDDLAAATKAASASLTATPAPESPVEKNSALGEARPVDLSSSSMARRASLRAATSIVLASFSCRRASVVLGSAMRSTTIVSAGLSMMTLVGVMVGLGLGLR
eukprot:scaffold116327_cov42-Phaeocystis_antarctica.AAC.1